MKFILQLFENGTIISWDNLKDRHKLANGMFSQWPQWKHAVSASGKKLIIEYSDVKEKNTYQNHYVTKAARVLFLHEVSSKEV